jgi:hypothetical protein
MQIAEIKIDKIDRKKGIDFMDTIRDGRSTDVDLLMNSAILLTILEKINEIVDHVNSMKLEVAGLRNDVGTAIIKKPIIKKAYPTKGGKNVEV